MIAANARTLVRTIACTAVLAFTVPAAAEDAATRTEHHSKRSRELPANLQCVPYARQVSGIRIFGDAHTWWGQAEGHFERGHSPRIGAVMAFQPHGNMRLGHVAAVSAIVDARTVLLRHANWSTINGRRGQIEDDVRAVDVSPQNDWSEVRVWYDPIQALGGTAWPVHGFIYNGRNQLAQSTRRAVSARAAPAARASAAKRAVRTDIIGQIIRQNTDAE